MKQVIGSSLAVCMLLTLGLQGCTYLNSSLQVLTGPPTLAEQMIGMGTVESVRAVKIGANNGPANGMGMAGSNRNSAPTGFVGGIAGAVANNTLETAIAIKDGLEITVHLDDGNVRVITQESTGEVFQTGDRVRLLSSDNGMRITH